MQLKKQCKNLAITCLIATPLLLTSCSANSSGKWTINLNEVGDAERISNCAIESDKECRPLMMIECDVSQIFVSVRLGFNKGFSREYLRKDLSGTLDIRLDDNTVTTLWTSPIMGGYYAQHDDANTLINILRNNDKVKFRFTTGKEQDVVLMSFDTAGLDNILEDSVICATHL